MAVDASIDPGLHLETADNGGERRADNGVDAVSESKSNLTSGRLVPKPTAQTKIQDSLPVHGKGGNRATKDPQKGHALLNQANIPNVDSHISFDVTITNQKKCANQEGPAERKQVVLQNQPKQSADQQAEAEAPQKTEAASALAAAHQPQ